MHANQATKAQNSYDGYGVVGAMAAMAGEARQLEVPAELNRLEKAVAFASESFAELSNRLDGKVTRGSEPQTAAAGNDRQLVAAGPMTMFGQEVRSNASRIEGLGEHIQDLLRRLEV